MYLPSVFEEARPGVLAQLIRSHPLSTFVVHADGELVANHIPLILDTAAGTHGVLRGHVARANSVWKFLNGAADAVAIFQGPQAYISPNWYPSKQADGKVVPTWNYAVVHAHGRPRAIEDREWLRALVVELTALHEAPLPAPWQVSDAPAPYIDQMLNGIVDIEMPIARLQGKWKVSQNRSTEDRGGVVNGLETQQRDAASLMAKYISDVTR